MDCNKPPQSSAALPCGVWNAAILKALGILMWLAAFTVPCSAWSAVPTINSFTSSRASVGQYTITHAFLNWSVSGATTISIDNGIGNVSNFVDPSVSVSPSTTTRYTLTATNASGSVSASVQLNYIALVLINPGLYKSEHALFIIPDSAQVTFPDWNSVYSSTNINGYVALLKSTFPADYMMVVVAANQLGNKVPNVLTYRHLADGIGQGVVTGVGVPNICRYHLGTGMVLDSAFAVLDHEIGHNWGVQAGIEVGSGHWFSNTNVGGQMADNFTDDGYATVKQIVGNSSSGFTWNGVDNLTRNDSEAFADQDLYAMGLQPVFPDTYVLQTPVYNADHSMSAAAVNKYDHAWMVNKNGARVPGYQSSDKQFRLGFVYIARDLAEVHSVYQQIEHSIVHFENAEQIDAVKFRFQVPFLVETKFRASVKAHLEDLDGNASPNLTLTVPNYVISTDGNASFPFIASDLDGPAPAVSVIPSSANASISNGQVQIQGLSLGTHFFTLKAQDAWGKKAFTHFVVDVVSAGSYSFTAQTNTAVSTVVSSNAVLVTGISAAAPISVLGGAYAINGGAYKTISGLVNPSDLVSLQQTSAATAGTTTGVTLMVGYASGVFNVTTVPTVPSAPIIGIANSGDRQASVSFSAPVSDGGSAINNYSATSIPGNLSGSCTGPCSAITVGNLVNGTSYSFSVSATNSAGTGAASAASNSVTPMLPASSTILNATVSPSVFGQSVSFNASVSGNAPGGTVTFYDGATALCSAVALSNGAAQCSATLDVGSHNLTVMYGGDSNNSASGSSVLIHIVNKATTGLSIASHTPNPSLLGLPIAVGIQLQAVAPGAGIASGTVTISDGTVSCFITLPASSCNLTPLSSGSKNLSAVFGGDGNFSGSTASTLTHTVNPASWTVLTASASLIKVNKPVTFTASVGGTAPGGSINFKDGAVSISGCGARVLAGGVATCLTSALGLGLHTITAVYSGDLANPASTSNTLSEKVVLRKPLNLPGLMLLLF
ncbi:MAG: Ig-like domain-containing protein [Pseudomonadota bacterium]